MASAHSSVIVTIGATLDTRTRDQLVFPFLARPQSMTIYVRFVEMGTVVQSVSGTLRVLQIGDITGTAPLLGIEASPSVYRIRFNNGIAAAQTSAVGSIPTLGQRIELRGVFTVTAGASPTATCFLGQSINEGAEVTSTPTTALIIPPIWSDTKMSLNSVGAVAGTTGQIALRDVRIIAGVKTLQECRIWAGTD